MLYQVLLGHGASGAAGSLAPRVADAIDFRYTQADAVNFPFTQADAIDFRYTQADAISFAN